MVHVVKDKNLSEKLKSFVRTPFFIPVLFLLFLLITIPVISLITSKPVDIRQRAASQGTTATINVEPLSGSVAPNQQFTADVVIDGGGQPFNAAQATISLAGNITVQSLVIVPVSQGGCNLTFATQNTTPSVGNLSFAGAILNGSSLKCTLYTLNLHAGSTGSGGILVSNSQVKSSDDNAEIFLSSQNGTFTVSTTPIDPIAQSVLAFSPLSGAIVNGSNFALQVRVNTNGQTVNGVETDVTFPTALFDVISIDDTNSDFNVPAQEVIGNGVVSIAYGSITPKSGNLLVTTINLRAKATGNADISFVNPSVVSDISNKDVLKDFINGAYSITASTQPTPTTQPTTPVATFTPTPVILQPTATPIVPTSTPRPPTPTLIPPTPTAIPPTPTLIPNLTIALFVTPQVTATYRSALVISGSKSQNATLVFVNNITTGAIYPSSTSWQFPITLVKGINSFQVYAQDSAGVKSNITTVTIQQHRLGDFTGDDIIDLTDLSIFGSDWEKTGSLNNQLSDMNYDNVVNLTDFSIFAKAYGN